MGKRWDLEAIYSQSNLRKQIKLVSTDNSLYQKEMEETFSNWLSRSKQSNKEGHLACA